MLLVPTPVSQHYFNESSTFYLISYKTIISAVLFSMTEYNAVSGVKTMSQNTNQQIHCTDTEPAGVTGRYEISSFQNSHCSSG